MGRIKVTTTLDKDLYARTRAFAKEQGLKGANDVIERAVSMYFDSLDFEVWEQEKKGGWVKRITVFADRAIICCSFSQFII